METSNLLLSFFSCCFLLSSEYIGSEGSPLHHHHHSRRQKHEVSDRGFRPTKMFVFGDSYADTGNIRKSLGSSWKEPYGTTFPGKPAGRFSDGRILTDYIAKFLGVKSPLAYEWMKLGGEKLKNGLNFAYGGSGVFNTLGDILPNMSSQIGFFEKLTHDSVYTKRDLQSSVVLVCLAGNDYGVFFAQGGSMQDLQKFIPRVITQLGANLKRLRQLGANKVAVTSLEPLGCLPRITLDSSFQQCNTTQNLAVAYHNLLLQQAVAKLNNESKTSPFFIIDLYTSFTTVLSQKGDAQGGSSGKGKRKRTKQKEEDVPLKYLLNKGKDKVKDSKANEMTKKKKLDDKAKLSAKSKGKKIVEVHEQQQKGKSKTPKNVEDSRQTSK